MPYTVPRSRSSWVLALVCLGLAGFLVLLVAIGSPTVARADTLTVTNTADSGPGSLRQVLDDAQPGDYVDFDLTYPATITLTSGELEITKSLTVTGPGPDLLAVSGNYTHTIFSIHGPYAPEPPITVTLSGLTIRDGYRPGLGSYRANSTVKNVVFRGNKGGWGGGMRCDDGHVALEDVLFIDNTADRGGGIYISNPATLINVTFLNNSAESGGAVYNYFNRPLMTGVVMSGNSAESGGAVYSTSGGLTLTNVLISGNVAVEGGGLYMTHPGTTTLTHVTFSGNRAQYGGAVHYSLRSGPEKVYIRNSVFWGNRATEQSNQFYGSGIVANCIIEGSNGSGPDWDTGSGTDAGGNLDADPRFVDAASAWSAPTTAGDYRVHAGPAMDSGDNALVPPGLNTDLAGDPRIVNGTVDMGAYELQPGLYLYKAAQLPWAQPGQPLSYTIRAFNTFTDTVMTGGMIYDDLPAGLTFVGPIALDPPGAGTAGPTPPHLVTGLNLQPGTSATVTLPVAVEATATFDHILNTASLASDQVPEPLYSSHELEVCGGQITVTTVSDDGPGSLRRGIADTCPGGTIDFDLAYPATITLPTGELAITRPLTITGPGPDLLAVSGSQTSRVFSVDKPAVEGAIKVSISGLTMRDGYVTGTNGGGLYTDELLTLVNVSFADNKADASPLDPSGWGGGLCCSGALTDVTFIGNEGTWGGGMYGVGPLTEVLFEANSASAGGGGAILGGDDTVLRNVAFRDNYSQRGAGLMLLGGSPVLRECQFAGNWAEGSGGGLWLNNVTPSVVNVIFSGNRAGYGGGLYNYEYSHANLTNVTFSGNHASEYGGAIGGGWAGSFTLQNGILWGNSAGISGDQVSDPGEFAHSLVQGSGGSGAGWDSSLGDDLGGNLDADPLFLSPADPMLAPTTAGVYRLHRGSPAIDAGNNDLLPTWADADLLGWPRIINGVVDMGAYETGHNYFFLPVIAGE